MTRKEASIIIGNIPINGDGCYTISEYQEAKAMAIKALEQDSCEQIKWERDTAIAQLKELGYGLGEKPKIDVLDKIRAEIEGNMESIIGKYNSSIPKFNMSSYKIERNKARKECISIIDKYKAEQG